MENSNFIDFECELFNYTPTAKERILAELLRQVLVKNDVVLPNTVVTVPFLIMAVETFLKDAVNLREWMTPGEIKKIEEREAYFREHGLMPYEYLDQMHKEGLLFDDECR